MTPNERAMIEDLFDRIRTMAMPDRDMEAARLIDAEMARTPGAAYALAQTVLVQDHALKEASEKLRQAEAAAQDYRDNAPRQQGSFLDRVMGAQRPDPAPAAPGPAEPAGGGFLRGALQTAAGVAGGALLFEGVRSLFGGGGFGSGASGASIIDNPGLEGGLGSTLAGPWGASKPESGEADGKTGADDKGTDDDDPTDLPDHDDDDIRDAADDDTDDTWSDDDPDTSFA